MFLGNVIRVHLKINPCQRWAEQLPKLAADSIRAVSRLMENSFSLFFHPGLLFVLLLVIGVDCQRTLPEGSVLTLVCESRMFAQKLFIDLPSVAQNGPKVNAMSSL